MSAPRLAVAGLEPAGGHDADPRALARRGLRFVLALVAASLVGAVLWQTVAPPAEPLPEHPSSLSGRADGFRGIHDVLSRLGFPVQRLLASYGQLPAPESTALWTLDPTSREALELAGRAPRAAGAPALLRTWVERGGHLLLALPGPAWASVAGGTIRLGEHDSDAIAAEVAGDDLPLRVAGDPAGALDGTALPFAAGTLAPPEPDQAARLRSHLSRAEALVSFGAEPAGPARIEVFDRDGLGSPWQIVARLGELPLVLGREVGMGRLWVVSSAYPFANLAVKELGAAALLAALAEVTSARGERTILFDEYCHGLSAPKGFFSWLTATALRVPLLALLALGALLAWRGALRLGPPRPARALPRRAKEELVIALAELLRRAGRQRMAAGWLLRAYETRHPGVDLSPLARRLAGRSRLDDAGLVRFARALDAAAARARR